MCMPPREIEYSFRCLSSYEQILSLVEICLNEDFAEAEPAHLNSWLHFLLGRNSSYYMNAKGGKCYK